MISAKPIGCALTSIIVDNDLARRYHADGYLIINLGLEPELLADVREDMARFRTQECLDLWPQSAPIRQLATHPKILALLCQLYAREPIPFQTLNYYNSPGQRMHSDMIHFNSLPMGYMCGVWVALEPVTIQNGPLFYYPHSQLLNFVDFEDIGLTPTIDRKQFLNNLGQYSTWLEKYIAESATQRSLFTCDVGDCLIWASNMIHGSIKPQTGYTRMSQVSHYYFENCQYYTPAFSSRRNGHIHYRHLKLMVSSII